tara:strand:- start:15156 stop:15536 length:381 start_codon:yes stop_codon:yes gene_type:complete
MDYIFLSHIDRSSAQNLANEVLGDKLTHSLVAWGQFWGNLHYVCVRTREPDDNIVRVGYATTMEGYYLGTINRVWEELNECKYTLGSLTVHPTYQRFDSHGGGFTYPCKLPKNEFEILLKGPANVY